MSGKVTARLAALTAALALFGAVASPVGAAARGLPPDIKLEVLDAAGNPEPRAGIAPDRLVLRLTPPEGESTKDLEIGFPPGMSGDPVGIPTCSRTVFEAGFGGECPPDTQVGVLRPNEHQQLPIFNLGPAPGQLAAFGTTLFSIPNKFSGRLRPDDLGLTVRVDSLATIPVEGKPNETLLEFWGVPADHQEGTPTARRAFLTTPTRCDRGPLTLTLRQDSWEQPGDWGTGSVDTGIPPVGCGELPFSAALDFSLDTPLAGSPTGVSVDLGLPGSGNGIDSPTSSQARSARIEFPAGMGVSAGAATHLVACGDAQLSRGTDAPASCPAASKVGSVEIKAPQLRAPLLGDVYLGEERPGARFRLFIVAADPSSGVEAKLVGTMRPDPATGRLTAVLEDLPEVSFSHLLMRFDGGPRALLLAPEGCGSASASATLTPYSGGAPAQAGDSVEIGPAPGGRCGAAAPFAPTLTAALSAGRGGQPTSFSAAISRRDGEQAADRFAIEFPPGLSARLGAVGRCPEGAVAAAACGPESRIGSAFVEVGAGPETAQLNGQAYLTGPYRRDPYGVALVFDAALGPFRLGSFVVRAGLEMDPSSGQVSVRSDSMPHDLEGVPVRFRAIGLEIDRPGFMRAPTSCTPKQVSATVVSAEGTTARPSAPLAVSGCVALPFRPALSLDLTGRRELRRGGKPGLRIGMRFKPGEAALRSLSLLMPPALRLSGGGLQALCARAAALRGACPKGSRVGTGSGRTPLLEAPLKGPVYVVQPRGGGEPDLWTELRGGGVELSLRSTSKSRHGRVRTSFQDLPDVPLSSFAMRLDGGEDGALSLDGNPCAKARSLSAAADLLGHNGARRERRLQVGVPTGCRGR